MDSHLVAVAEPDILYRDEEAAVDHARRFLNALGVQCDVPETMDTPRRMAEAYRDMLSSLAPRGIGVVIEAEHLCMTVRGVKATGTSMSTSALRGLLLENPQSRAEFLVGIER